MTRQAGHSVLSPPAKGGGGTPVRRAAGAHNGRMRIAWYVCRARCRRPLTNRLALMTDGDWRDGGFRQRRPSVETFAWVAASMGQGSRIVGYRRLTGGVCSAVNRLTVERRGMRTFVVLRQYPGGLGLHGSLEKEIANLGVVAGSGLPVPGILATDVAGASTGARHRC